MYFVNEFKRKNRGFSFSTLNNNEPNFPFLMSQVESLGNRLWDSHVGSWSEHVLRSHTCFGIRGKGGRGGRGLLWCSHREAWDQLTGSSGTRGLASTCPLSWSWLPWTWAEWASHSFSQLRGKWHHIDTLKLEVCVCEVFTTQYLANANNQSSVTSHSQIFNLR